MPTVLRLHGLRVEIDSNDHQPAHVHVNGTNTTAVFALNCPDGLPTLREVYGFSLAEVNTILRALVQHLTLLCKRWGEIHGHFYATI